MANEKNQQVETPAFRCVKPFSAWGIIYNTGDLVDHSKWVGEGKTDKSTAVEAFRNRMANGFVELPLVG